MSYDPISSEAYASVKALLPSLAQQVLRELQTQPMTCEELERRLGLRHQTCSATLTGLKKDGQAEKSGAYRPTTSGRRANVWRLAHVR